MIGHQAVGVHLYPAFDFQFPEIAQIHLEVTILRKHHLTIVTSLDNVVASGVVSGAMVTRVMLSIFTEPWETSTVATVVPPSALLSVTM
jgi:hypothetical protein